MGAVSEYLTAIGRSIVTLGDGLAVTLSYMFRKPITIQYPDRTAKPVVSMLPERSRGILEVDIETCTGCSMCAKQCPIDCLHMVVEKDEETKKRILKSFVIDVGKCMFCGLCVEACPTGAIRHSHEFEGAMYDIERLRIEFVDEPLPVAKPPKKTEVIERPPYGAFVRQFLYEAGGQPPAPGPRPKSVIKTIAAPPEKQEAAAGSEKKPEVKAEPESKEKPGPEGGGSS